jgi:nicotinamide mononucleotide transporter
LSVKSTTRKDGLAAAILIGAIGVVAIGMALGGAASWLESLSFVTGAACVWLTVGENIWNFPVGMANVVTFGFVFLRAGLYADAGLQVIYLILCGRGWYLWLHGGHDRTRLQVTRTGRVELCGLVAGIVLLTLLLWLLLQRVGGSASFWDALTTALSLGSQWLLNRKRLESWMGWILVDAIYVPLYVSKSLYLTAILYAIFLGLATMGLRRWHESWRAQHAPPPSPAPFPSGEIVT